MKYKELLVNVMWLLILITFFVGIGYIKGWNDGKLSEQKAILERLREVDSIHRQDSIKQQRNDKSIKQKIQVKYKDGHKEYQINPYPESGYEPFKSERGKFQAEVIMTVFDNDDQYPVFQKTSDKWYWFDESGNVYSSKTSNKVLFNLLHK